MIRKIKRQVERLSLVQERLERVEKKVDEALFYINMTKNGQTISLSETSALTRLFTGQKMIVDKRDVSLAPHLMLDGFWEEDFTRIFRSVLKSDSVVLDVGANFGYFGTIACTNVETGSVHLFEPNPLLVDYIKRTIAINGLWNKAHLVPKAVGSSNKPITITVPGDYFGSGSAVMENRKDITNIVSKKEFKTFSAPQTTIDEYVKVAKLKKVDVMKIDVEGFEEHVYEGMRGTIKKNPNMIVFLEFTSGAYKDPKKFFGEIKKDFKFIYTCDNELDSINKFEQTKNICDRDGFVMLGFSNKPLV